MKHFLLFLIMFLLGLGHCFSQLPDKSTNHLITGQWIKQSPAGKISLQFKEEGFVEGDFENDNSIEFISEYELKNDTIMFIDKQGISCPGAGIYKITLNEYYMSFNLIDDSCGGRIKTTMGYWTKPNYEVLLKKLSEEISNKIPTTYLNRARIYLAMGNSELAKKDLDSYITVDSLNASAYINRAASKMPIDLQGVIDDCTKAIKLDLSNKNAYFLRGLALYSIDKKDEACEDFHHAIMLGFYILKYAESEKCSEYWESIAK